MHGKHKIYLIFKLVRARGVKLRDNKISVIWIPTGKRDSQYSSKILADEIFLFLPRVCMLCILIEGW